MIKQKNIESIFKVINKSLFTINSTLDYDRLTDAIILLANSVHNYEDDDESLWYIGESDYCALPELITGAFWHYTEWHSGQWSKGYEALSALGQVFNPGMTYPETDNEVYIQLNEMVES